MKKLLILLLFPLLSFGQEYGCANPAACNFNPVVLYDDGISCVFALGCDECLDGQVIDNDFDNDGICNNDEAEGCLDPSACNYNENATDDDFSCIYQTLWYSDQDEDGLGDPNNLLSSCDPIDNYVNNFEDQCPNDPFNDIDGDGICGDLEIEGCMYSVFCNFNPDATDSCTDCCQQDNCGCIDSSALNYSEDALYNDFNCLYGEIDMLYHFHNVPGSTLPFSISPPFQENVFSNDIISYGMWSTNNLEVYDYSVEYPDIAYPSNYYFLFIKPSSSIYTYIIWFGSYDSYPNSLVYMGQSLFSSPLNINIDPYSDNLFTNLCNPASGGTSVSVRMVNPVITNYNILDGSITISGTHFSQNALFSGDFSFDLSPVLGMESSDPPTDCYQSYFNVLSNTLVPIADCTDQLAYNFNNNALEDDNSCCYVAGCTDSVAFNYNENACFDDGSCESVNFGCMNNNAINYDSEANTDDGSCLIWNYPLITSCDMTIGITTESFISLDDEDLELGDWIGAFYLDENGNEVCGGAFEWLGENSVISLWADDEEYYDNNENCVEGCGKNGFDTGEEIIWKLWDSTDALEMTNILEFEFISDEPNIFTCNGVELVDYIFSYSTVTQDINLNDGWNIFSTYINPPNKNIQNVTANLNVEIVKNCCGSVYWPLIGVNNIGDIQIDEGYWIKLDNASTLSITGDIIPFETEINLSEGWSIIPYLHTQPNEISSMMLPIIDNIDIIKDDNGNVYWPFIGIDNIINMSPGEGYQIKTNAPVSFSYTDGNGRLGFDEYNFVSKKYNPPINTGNNMVIAILNDAWIDLPADGDEIIVFDSEGLVVGNAPYKLEGTVVTVWGDDKTTDEKDGLYAGEQLNFQLLRHDQDLLENINILSWKEGSGVYSVNGISIAGTLSQNIVQEKQLIEITDLLGRDVNTDSKQSTLLYIYDDGSIEKKYILK